jgi:hypothetical protein
MEAAKKPGGQPGRLGTLVADTPWQIYIQYQVRIHIHSGGYTKVVQEHSTIYTAADTRRQIHSSGYTVVDEQQQIQ